MESSKAEKNFKSFLKLLIKHLEKIMLADDVKKHVVNLIKTLKESVAKMKE